MEKSEVISFSSKDVNLITDWLIFPLKLTSKKLSFKGIKIRFLPLFLFLYLYENLLEQ
jgi:hypothetical protein